MQKYILVVLCAFGIMLPVHPQPTDNKIYIDVGQAAIKKSLLALPAFVYSGSPAEKSSVSVGQEIYGVVNNDLAVSGLFTMIKPEAYLEDPAKVGLRPAPESANGFSFSNWKTIGTEFLIRAGYRVSRGQVEFEAYVYYVPQGKTILAKTYKADAIGTRKLAHSFANDVVEALTGKKGMFNSKILVMSNRDASNKRIKEVWVMDWDGANSRKLTNHKAASVSPAWHPSGESIIYTTFAAFKKAGGRINQSLFNLNLRNGDRKLISFREGLNLGGTYAPNGNSIYLTLSKNANPDIYRISTDGKSAEQITRGGGLNMEADVSPDGTKIAFSSTRAGKPMIYVANIDGSNLQRVTFAGEYNSTPEWSPDGKLITFAGRDGSHFDIFTVEPFSADKKITRLTSAKKPNGRMANNEYPTFSPDGRHIMFVSDRTGTYQIYVTDLKGTEERRVTFDSNNYAQTRWSPRLE